MRTRMMVLAVAMAFVLGSAGTAMAGLISHYAFESNLDNSVTGAPTADYQPDPDTPTYVDGPATFGKAVQFLGPDDCLRLLGTGGPHQASMALGSIALYFKTPESFTDPFVFCGAVDREGTPSEQMFAVGSGWYGGSDSGELSLYVRDADGDTIRVQTSGAANWRDAQWHHFAAAWNGGGGDVSDSVRMWLDGKPLAITDTYPTPPGSYWGDLDDFPAWWYAPVLGGFNSRGTITLQFEGAVDEFRVYEGMITQDDVNGLLPPDAPVSEPASLGLLGLALLGLRKKRRS